MVINCQMPVILTMAGRTESQMWSAFREVDRKMQSLIAFRDHLVHVESVANSVADRAMFRVISLGHQFDRLEADRSEAQLWLADVVRSGVSSLRSIERTDNAWQMLLQIRKESLEVCAQAKLLNERRNRFRADEEYSEVAQYPLEEEIDRLRADLEDIVSAGFVRD